MKARVHVMLKDGVLDPQGEAVRHALGTLGFAGVTGVRQGKVIDLDLAATVERHLQVAAQAAIDLGVWVVSDHGWREPRNYADTFTVLAEEGFLQRPVAYRLSEMAGYRNILVHAYVDTSHDVTVRLATEGLADLSALAARFAAEYVSP